MNEQELYRRVDQLGTRMNRMEGVVQALLTVLTTSGATSTGERIQMQNILQEFSSQKQSETGAIHQALLAGDKIKAIKLYRSIYGVGLQEAKDAIDAM